MSQTDDTVKMSPMRAIKIELLRMETRVGYGDHLDILEPSDPEEGGEGSIP